MDVVLSVASSIITLVVMAYAAIGFTIFGLLLIFWLLTGRDTFTGVNELAFASITWPWFLMELFGEN